MAGEVLECIPLIYSSLIFIHSSNCILLLNRTDHDVASIHYELPSLQRRVAEPMLSSVIVLEILLVLIGEINSFPINNHLLWTNHLKQLIRRLLLPTNYI